MFIHYMHSTGAILAMGRIGRETTLWPAQEEFFDRKFATLNQINTMN